MKCENCKWFRREKNPMDPNGYYDGNCHYYPQPEAVTDDNFCSKYQAKPKKKKK
jgi:hypothetical protein